MPNLLKLFLIGLSVTGSWGHSKGSKRMVISVEPCCGEWMDPSPRKDHWKEPGNEEFNETFLNKVVSGQPVLYWVVRACMVGDHLIPWMDFSPKILSKEDLPDHWNPNFLLFNVSWYHNYTWRNQQDRTLSCVCVRVCVWERQRERERSYFQVAIASCLIRRAFNCPSCTLATS